MNKKIVCPYCSGRFKWNHVCFKAPGFEQSLLISRDYVEDLKEGLEGDEVPSTYVNPLDALERLREFLIEEGYRPDFLDEVQRGENS